MKWTFGELLKCSPPLLLMLFLCSFVCLFFKKKKSWGVSQDKFNLTIPHPQPQLPKSWDHWYVPLCLAHWGTFKIQIIILLLLWQMRKELPFSQIVTVRPVLYSLRNRVGLSVEKHLPDTLASGHSDCGHEGFSGPVICICLRLFHILLELIGWAGSLAVSVQSWQMLLRKYFCQVSKQCHCSV